MEGEETYFQFKLNYFFKFDFNIFLLIWVKCIIEYFRMTLACSVGQGITCFFFLEVIMHSVNLQ